MGTEPIIFHAQPPQDWSTFKCYQCGNCCRGDGYVCVTADDVVRMAAELQLTQDEFLLRYTQPPKMQIHARRGHYWLKNHIHAPDDCIFLERKQCILHSAKPEQCQGFPLAWNHPEMLSECFGYMEMTHRQQQTEANQ